MSGQVILGLVLVALAWLAAYFSARWPQKAPFGQFRESPSGGPRSRLGRTNLRNCGQRVRRAERVGYRSHLSSRCLSLLHVLQGVHVSAYIINSMLFEELLD